MTGDVPGAPAVAPVDRDALAAFARAEASERVELGGSRSMAIEDERSLWVVLDGEALVFATDHEHEGPARPRQLIATRPAGTVVAAVDGREVGRRWILVSTSGCTVAVVPATVLRGGSGPGFAELVAGVDEWLHVAGGLAPPATAPDGSHPAARLAAARSPLAHHEIERLDAQLAAEAELVDASEAAVELASDLALDRLGSVLERARARRIRSVAGDELLAACRVVGESMGVAIRAPHPEDLVRATPIDAIAQASKVRARRVELGPRWWRDAGTAMVGFTHEGEPVALVPRSRRGYELVLPATGEGQLVDEHLAAELRDDGVELVRPLPAAPLTTRTVARFALRGSGRDVTRLLVLALVMGLLALVPALATRLVFEAIVPQRQSERLVALTAGLVGIAFGSLFLQLARGVALLRARTRSDHSLQLALWDRLLRLPAPFFRRYQTGDLTERSMVIEGIRDTVDDAVIVTLLAGVFGLFNLAVMVSIDPSLAIVGLLLTVAGAAVLFTISRVYQGPLKGVLQDRREMSAVMHELLTGIVKVRTSGSERRIFARWAERYARDSRRAYETYRINDLRTVFEGTFPTAMLLILFATVVALGRDAVPAASFLAFYVALGQLQTAVVNIARSTVTLLEARPVLEQARPILDEAAEADLDREHPGRLRGAFGLHQVEFAYPGTVRPIFDGLSLTIEPGEFVAVVGPSGSGKSTLLRLILGFEEVQSGTVTVDGIDVAALDMEAARRQMGVVLQQTALLPGSVFDNIAGSVPLTVEEAWDAARRAGFADDIERLPDGMATNIGDGVGILSGGQRQRLQIARALAGRPRVLLLDEATSALDNLTQSVVTRTVAQLDVTRVVIAHRLSTISSADRVVVIAGGRVVQDGPFAELAGTPGPFADLIARQQL